MIDRIKRFIAPVAIKKEGRNKVITYIIGTHSPTPISFTLFFAMKKEKTRISIPNNLGIILVKKNIKKEILSLPISTNIELPIKSNNIEIKYKDRIVYQKPFLSKHPLLDNKSHPSFIW